MIYIVAALLFLAAVSTGQDPGIIDFTGCVTGEDTLKLRCKHDIKSTSFRYEFSFIPTNKAEITLNGTIRSSGFTQLYKNRIDVQNQEIQLTMIGPFTNEYNGNYSCTIKTDGNKMLQKIREIQKGQVATCGGIGTFMFAYSTAWLLGLILSLSSLH